MSTICFRLIRLTKRVRLGSLVNSVLMRGRSLVLGSDRLEWEFWGFHCMAKIKLLTTPKAGMTEAKMTTIRSPKATVNSQKDCRTDFMLDGA